MLRLIDSTPFTNITPEANCALVGQSLRTRTWRQWRHIFLVTTDSRRRHSAHRDCRRRCLHLQT